ncbi:MAG: T9SS type A sorting domain-containing protein [Flavobacteriales bacterium]
MSQPTISEFSNITTSSDGALLINRVYAVDVSSFRTWIIKMGEYGCLESECDFLQLQEVEQPIQVQLYPNPASHMFYVEGNRPDHTKSEFGIFNLMGQKLLDATFAPGSDRLEFDINNLPSGLNILQWSAKRKIITSKRFVKP